MRRVIQGVITLIFVWLIVWHSPAADAQQVNSEPASLKVMSFNIRFGTAADGDNHWDRRHELVVKTIKAYGPDLLGTQETLDFQADYLRKQLDGYESFGRSRDKDPQRGEQCTIFFRRDRFEKVETGQFWLSESPQQAGSKSWDTSLPRIATWAILKDKKQEGRTLLFLNTHFDHRGPRAREESAKLIRKWLAEEHADKAIVITGDFNCGIDSAPYRSLVGKTEKLTIVDSFRAMHPKGAPDSGTFGGFRGTRSGARIDWLLCTPGLEIVSAAIDHANQDGRYPSDHYPVNATLKWKK